jgi:phthalate 4,5-cis-dihydrodiol dehydrogenase
MQPSRVDAGRGRGARVEGATPQKVRSIGVGVLGLGLAGREAARVLSRSKLARLVAVCDLDESTVQSIAGTFGVLGYTDYADMCKGPEVEAIFVATPTHLRVPHIGLALRAGKHLLVEKPLAANSKDAHEVVRWSAACDRVVMSANTRGRDAVVQAMARVVQEEALGQILSLTNVMYKPWVLSPRYDYELDPELGGGVNFRQAPHQVEIARTIIDGPVKSVTATVGRVETPVDSFGNFNALLEFQSGATASLVFNGYGYFDTSELTWGIGEGGRRQAPGRGIALRQAESWTKVKYSSESPIQPPASGRSGRPGLSIFGLTIVSCERGDVRPSRNGVLVYDYDSIREIPVPPSSGGMSSDLEEFYGAVRRGEACRYDARWGAKTVDVCEAIWTSAQVGGSVRL